jgi:hypothetical protein
VPKSLKVKKLPLPQLFAIGALCALAYAPTLNLPLMEDDYPNIAQALKFGSPAAPLGDPIFRMRATSYWTMQGLYRTFRMFPPAYHATSLVLHIANAWLVYLALLAWPQTRGAAIWAAGFFAVHEGHQEAVMWFSAMNELLQFFFGVMALWLWMRGRRWLAFSLICFALALISKESAVLFIALFGFALLGRIVRFRNACPAWTLLLYVALAAGAVAVLATTRAYSFRFSDGSFSLAAPFWITWPRGFARLMWIWGWVSAAIVAIHWREEKMRNAVIAALAWMAIALLPYSFLTYSTQIPSRQTYLAGAGLAALFGLAIERLWQDSGSARKVAAVLALAALLHNVGYIWFRKRAQFIARAQPTEQLIRMARETGGPIWVQCFPLAPITAEATLRLDAGIPTEDIIWSQSDAAIRKPNSVFCYSPSAK